MFELDSGIGFKCSPMLGAGGELRRDPSPLNVLYLLETSTCVDLQTEEGLHHDILCNFNHDTKPLAGLSTMKRMCIAGLKNASCPPWPDSA
jgi:hypothetical protein